MDEALDALDKFATLEGEASRGMMVEFVKQVHLQKVVGAGMSQ